MRCTAVSGCGGGRAPWPCTNSEALHRLEGEERGTRNKITACHDTHSCNVCKDIRKPRGNILLLKSAGDAFWHVPGLRRAALARVACGHVCVHAPPSAVP